MEHRRLSLDILSVDRGAPEPMHRQIYGALRRFILDGRIPPHALLPSTRTLAEDLKVGRNTVIAAYDQLLAEGFIEARTTTGRIGVKCWINKGEVMPEGYRTEGAEDEDGGPSGGGRGGRGGRG